MHKIPFPFGKKKNFDQISEGWGGVQNVHTSAKCVWNSRKTSDKILLQIFSKISSCWLYQTKVVSLIYSTFNLMNI